MSSASVCRAAEGSFGGRELGDPQRCLALGCVSLSEDAARWCGCGLGGGKDNTQSSRFMKLPLGAWWWRGSGGLFQDGQVEFALSPVLVCKRGETMC